MNVLDRFEHTVERLMEGSIARIFRSQLQPAEIARKLERAMVEKQIVSVGTTLVPNDYRVSLHARDLETFKQFLPSLCRQMESHVTDVAARRGFTLIDRARVEIAADDGVSRRAIRVVAHIADRAPRPIADEGSAQRTEIFRGIRANASTGHVRLRITSGPRRGQEIEIGAGVTTVGRSHDNDVVLEANDVSRNHARIESTADQVKLIDLDSTNGTRVNGSPIRSQNIGAGDTLTFGTITVEVLSPSSGGR